MQVKRSEFTKVVEASIFALSLILLALAQSPSAQPSHASGSTSLFFSTVMQP